MGPELHLAGVYRRRVGASLRRIWENAHDWERLAHSNVCRHSLGPLGDAPVVNDGVRCPWHGYVFDVATGTCAVTPHFTLERAPHVSVDDGRMIAAPFPS